MCAFLQMLDRARRVSPFGLHVRTRSGTLIPLHVALWPGNHLLAYPAVHAQAEEAARASAPLGISAKAMNLELVVPDLPNSINIHSIMLELIIRTCEGVGCAS